MVVEEPTVNQRPGIMTLYPLMGYIALWPALYAVGVFVLTWRLFLSGYPNFDSIIYILLCAHSCYLLDRVKISDRRQDPADSIALPLRTMIFARWAKAIRMITIFELLLATIAGWMIHPLLAAIPLLALIVVHFYAGRGATPDSPRLKDLPGLKAFMIAGGHLSLTLAVILGNHPDIVSQMSIFVLLGILGVLLIVAGDAILCDIDDHESDLAYNTKSLPVMLGNKRAWLLALGLICLGSLLICVHQYQMIWVGTLLILSTLLTSRNTNHRDFVDARLLLIVLLGFWIAA